MREQKPTNVAHCKEAWWEVPTKGDEHSLEAFLVGLEENLHGALFL